MGRVIARVEPLTSARALRGPFDYSVPESLGSIRVGTVLEVPFARRKVLGVVVGLAETSELPAERLAAPHGALEADVPPDLVELGLWAAEEYSSTPARGLALVLPPGTGTGAKARARARRELTAAITDAGREAVVPAAPAPRLGPRQRRALELLAAAPAPAADLGRRAGCDHSTLRRLQELGLITLDALRVRRAPEHVTVGAAAPSGRELTPAQAAAVEAVLARRDAADRRVLLNGVTGSGKTEVYLRVVAATLEQGRSAIVLVPEIGLTPQTVARFRERFGDTVAVLHSGLSLGERFDEWSRLRSGEARVCVGPRSAVFAPLADVGLIVIDEEHDPSYKQEGDPRYDARDVAERRAERSGAILVAGSATPRPESWHRLERVDLPERVDGRAMPPVEVVGMAGVSGPLHPHTREALEAVRERGEKAIVLLNRRGWSNFLSCRTCGRVWGCPNCDVTLVLHQAAGRVSCHHCGHTERIPEACPDCHSVSVARHGAGTERLERDLAEIAAPLPVFRLDSDIAARRSAAQSVLQRFDRAEAGVLIGTQMVAKGHDFPDVTLGVVLDADAQLRFPDFRAEERTFALVAQLAGRSGRGSRGGRVVVQALDPDARALRHAAAHDAEGFLEGELERRRVLRYPPYSHVIRVVCASEEGGRETDAAEAIRERIAAAGLPVLGPAALFRLQGRERAQLVVKSPERRPAVAAVREAVETVAADKGHRGVVLSVDVDPQ